MTWYRVQPGQPQEIKTDGEDEIEVTIAKIRVA